MGRLTRREFLRDSALVGVGFLAGCRPRIRSPETPLIMEIPEDAFRIDVGETVTFVNEEGEDLTVENTRFLIYWGVKLESSTFVLTHNSLGGWNRGVHEIGKGIVFYTPANPGQPSIYVGFPEGWEEVSREGGPEDLKRQFP